MRGVPAPHANIHKRGQTLYGPQTHVISSQSRDLFRFQYLLDAVSLGNDDHSAGADCESSRAILIQIVPDVHARRYRNAWFTRSCILSFRGAGVSPANPESSHK